MRHHRAARRARNVAAPVVVVRADLRLSADPAALMVVVRAVLRRSVDPAALMVVVRADLRRSVDPAAPVVRAVTSADPAVQEVRAVPVVRAVTSADPAVQAVPVVPTSAGPTTMTSADPITTIGDHRGTQGITTGAVGSTAPLGVTGQRPGAGVHRRRHRGMDHCRKHGAPRRRRSTTGASTSNQCGIRATTNGVSTSSGSGFHCRSNLPTGRPPRMPGGGRPPTGKSIHLSE
jgi:hypothetical protein